MFHSSLTYTWVRPPFSMAGPMPQTPSVTIKLDDSKVMRLEILRNRLQLSHWTKIQKQYDLIPDESVAKSIRDMKTIDPVAHDIKYSSWNNRYSDFSPEWRKKKSTDTGEIEGHLVAIGRPRLEHLGGIGDGCIFHLMQGLILDQPLPSTKVGDVRLNHLQFEITFTEPTSFRTDAEDSTAFKVGHENELYGEPERISLKGKFKEKKKQKSQSAADILADLVHALNIASRRGDNREHDEVEPEHVEDNQHSYNPAPFQSYFQLNGGRNDEDC